MLFQINFVVVSILVFVNLLLGLEISGKRLNTEGILFDNENKSATFSKSLKDFKDWSDIDEISKRYGLERKERFCAYGNGGWILYPEKNCKVGNSLEFGFIVGEACLPALAVGSIQPAGPINMRRHDYGLIAFESPYYTSEFKLIPFNGNLKLKSLFIFVPGEWLLQIITENRDGSIRPKGDPLCVTGIKKHRNLICGIPDVENQLGVLEANDLVSVNPGCLENYKRATTNCYSQGTFTISVDPASFKEKSNCKENLTEAESEQLQKYAAITAIWKSARFDTDTKSESQNDLKDVLKFITRILTISCPQISKEYLDILFATVELRTQPSFKQRDIRFLQDIKDTLKTCEDSIKFEETVKSKFPTCNRKPKQEMNNEDILTSHLNPILTFISRKCSLDLGFLDNLINISRKSVEREIIFWNEVFQLATNGFDISFEMDNLLHCLKYREELKIPGENSEYLKITDGNSI